MTIQFFIGYDKLGRPRPSRYQHEENGVLAICQALWDRLHSVEIPFIVIENPCFAGSQETTPDMIILSPYGLGVVEIKDWEGKIPVEFTKKTPPHQQVQAYGQVIYDALSTPPDPALLASRHPVDSVIPYEWLPNLPHQGKQPTIDTGVCFTHTLVDLSDYRKMTGVRTKKKRDPNRLEMWERFQLLTPAEMPAWAWSLRWELSTGEKDFNNSYSTPLGTIEQLTTLFFNARRYPDREALVRRVREPHAFLKLEGMPVPYRLDKEQHLIGRNLHVCDIVIPASYILASKEHARLLYQNDQYYLENLGENGTFLADGRAIEGLTAIILGQRFFCGGKTPGGEVCQFVLVDVKTQPVMTTKKAEPD
jgi:hypothetical protein